MEISHIVEFWEGAKEYIPAKDKQLAADHAVQRLVDEGVSDDELHELGESDDYMLEAIQEHTDSTDEEDDYNDYDDE